MTTAREIMTPDPRCIGESESLQEAARLIQGQDAQGRWIEDKWIDGRQFVDGVLTLARFISSAQAAEADVEPMLGLE